jgi:hypothetical protein
MIEVEGITGALPHHGTKDAINKKITVSPQYLESIMIPDHG